MALGENSVIISYSTTFLFLMYYFLTKSGKNQLRFSLPCLPISATMDIVSINSRGLNNESLKEGTAVLLAVVLLVMPAVLLLQRIALGDLMTMDVMQYLVGMAGFVYDDDYLDGGVYYHHEGSSHSEPRGSPSWIKAIAKAHDVNKEDLQCCVSGCENSADLGAHLTESRIMEILSLIGLGGTPVVPMCYEHHGTGPVEIEDTPCIYDTRTPIDLLWGKQSLSNVRCFYCNNYTIGPDSDDNYWCTECDHVVDDDGDCVTEGCTSEGCCDDDDDDDSWW